MSRLEQAESNLSEQQRRLLLWVLAYVEKLEARSDDAALDLLENGIPWKPQSKGKTKAYIASLSRTLAQLDRRGLVERIAPSGRTIALKLTILGKLVALRARSSA